ncbi:MAG: Ig-like domain-containing protein [Saprospiraceae bacterium]|nr:Ig-like domain-containing protein [Candidatus Opimibacter skivensis]
MFFQKHPFSLLLAVMVVFLASCAAPKSPTGGPVDTLPPVIIAEESTPNQQTNFKEDEITITFDEWFTIKDVATQLVISPLMPEQPVVKQKGKSIVITLPDSLLEETTYTLNFGSAIADLNEGNVLENYAFVFSTGDVLDSVKMSGSVINAVTLTPAEGVWVMLYPVGIDSAVYKRKPEYVAKTNKEGKWAMSNIRADSFNVVALKDDNLNFLYDQDTELFGWIDYNIYTLRPTALLPEIKVFPKVRQPIIRDVIHTVPGWIKVIVDGPVPKQTPRFNPEVEGAVTAWDGDTLHVWYNAVKNYFGEAILLEDTTRIKIAPGASPISWPLRVTTVTSRLHPLATAQFNGTVPFELVDTARITLVNDSLGMVPFTLQTDSVNKKMISIDAAWKPLSKYTLTFLPGAVKDIWGRMNDTIRHTIVVVAADQFGDFTVIVDGLDSTKNYVVLVKTGEVASARFNIDLQASAQLKKSGMAPGKYTIEVIEDLNGNGIWDSGDYHTRRQPERKRFFTPDPLRAGWELETKITWQ